MKIKLSKEKLSHFCNYLLATMLILNCQSVYQNSLDRNYHIYEITFAAIIIGSIVQISVWGMKESVFKELVLFAALYYLYLLLFMFFSVSSDEIISFISRFSVLPFVALYFETNAAYKEKVFFFKSFINIAVLISVISLVFYVFGTLCHLIPSTGYVNFEWGSNYRVISYFNLYYEIQWVDWIGFALKRNTACFVEGPMFCLVLIFSLLFYYRFANDVHIPKWKQITLILAVISTFSVSGLLFIILIGFITLLQKRNWKALTLIFGVPIILIVGIFFYLKKASTGSFSYRMDDYVAGLKTWLDYPIFGSGFNNFDALISNMSRSNMTGFSNSVFAILGQGGIVLFALYIIPTLKSLCIGLKKRRMDYLATSFTYMFCLFFIIFQTFYINFVLWGLMYLSVFYEQESQKDILMLE